MGLSVKTPIWVVFEEMLCLAQSKMNEEQGDIFLEGLRKMEARIVSDLIVWAVEHGYQRPNTLMEGLAIYGDYQFELSKKPKNKGGRPTKSVPSSVDFYYLVEGFKQLFEDNGLKAFNDKKTIQLMKNIADWSKGDPELADYRRQLQPTVDTLTKKKSE